jgi:hypothetical protein
VQEEVSSFVEEREAVAGMSRADQAATAGSPTMGSSLNGAIVSSVI